MKKTILLFAIIFTSIFTFGQVQVDEAPDFEVTTLGGETFILSEFWDQNPDAIVVLDFFFADSPLCKEVSPMINEAYNKFGCNEADVFFLSVNVNDDAATTQQYYDTLNLEYPMVIGEAGGEMIDTLYDVHAYPTLALMQKELYTPDPDTVYEIDDEDEIDTIYYYEPTNFIAKDIWPIIDADSLILLLLSYDLDTVSCTGAQNNPSGIAESQKAQPSISIFPNPAKDQFHILSSNLEGNYEIEILDISGKSALIRSEYFIKGASISINTENLDNGIYIVRIYNSDEQYSEKLFIK